jgi:SCP-2 sterol transfer family
MQTVGTHREGGDVAEYRSAEEFREVMDKVFAMMSEDPGIGPKLRDADVPQRFEFTDVDMVINVRAARDGEDANLVWVWTDDVDWDAKVRMSMSSETANKYFQGKENIAMAIARRRIKAGGDVKAALSLIPITKPIYERYRDLVAREYPHLEV